MTYHEQYLEALTLLDREILAGDLGWIKMKKEERGIIVYSPISEGRSGREFVEELVLIVPDPKDQKHSESRAIKSLVYLNKIISNYEHN